MNMNKLRHYPYLASFICLMGCLSLNGDPGFSKAAGVEKVTLQDRRVEVNDPIDIGYEAPDGYAITGLGMRAADGAITTLWIDIQKVNSDGTLGERQTIHKGTTPDRFPEGLVNLPLGYVAVGFGVNVIEFWDIGAITLWGAPLNRDGSLGPIREFRGGFQAHTATEKQILLPENRILVGVGIAVKDHNAIGIMAQSSTCVKPEPLSKGLHLDGRKLEFSERTRVQSIAPPGYVITGVSLRAAEGEITTLWMTVRKLNEDCTLGDPLTAVEGWYPVHEYEAEVKLPEGYVAVGIGLSMTFVSDIADLCLWGAPLKPDGSLGEIKEFRSGKKSAPGQALQRSVQASPGHVLTGMGFRTNEGETLGIMAISAKLAMNN